MQNTENQKYAQIGSRIKEAREREGLTQTELARVLGYNSPTAVSLIEAGDRKVNIVGLEKVAQALHCEVSFLINGTKTQLPDVGVALRAEGSLEQADVERIESYIELIKLQKKKHGDGSGINK